MTEIDESDEHEASGNKCLSCHYYNSCDDNDSGGLYCPSYRKKWFFLKILQFSYNFVFKKVPKP